MRRLLRSKKAQEGGEEGEGIIMTHEWALILVLSFLIPLMALMLHIFITGYGVQDNSFLGTSENTIIQGRFFNSPLCFAYEDIDTGRVYPGVIDASKFSQQRMDMCYVIPADYIAGCFRIELRDIVTGKSFGHAESKNFGKCLLEKLTATNTYYVVIKNGDEMRPGKMIIESNINV